VANNLRDAETDHRSGKSTLVARYGRAFGRIEFVALIVGSLTMIPILHFLDLIPRPGLLPLLSLPLAVPLIRLCYRAEGPGEHVRLLVETSRFLLVFGLLLSIGIVL